MKTRSRSCSNPNGTSAMKTKKRRRGRCVKFITEDLITEIISRLLAKDLLRFKSVSKSWCSLICTDPYFHRLQIERNASPLLLAGGRVNSASWSYIWSFYDFLIDLDSNNNLIKVHNPFGDDGSHVIGSCNGLLVLQQRLSRKMAVSNPITRKHRMLPPNPVSNVEFCGFGYDRVHDCYKLVTKSIRQRELAIYDLKSDMWYRRPSPALELSWMECVDGGVYFCRELYKRCGRREIKRIMCFVFAEEEFHEVETPDFGEVKYYPNMTVLDGRLGLVMKGLEDARHEVWMIDMECDSNKTYSWRWTKIVSLSCPKAMLPPSYNLEEKLLIVPLCFSTSKTKLLYDVGQRDLFWYDMVNKEFHKLSVAPLNGVHRLFRSFAPTFVGNGIF